MSENDSLVPYTLDDYFQSTPLGSIDKAVGNNLFGINHRQMPSLVPINKDSFGLTFLLDLNLIFSQIMSGIIDYSTIF